MTPGYLHLNLRRGCKSEMINAAMAALLPKSKCVDELFRTLGMSEIECEVSECSVTGIVGHSVCFYIGGKLIALGEKVHRNDLLVDKRSPKWERGPGDDNIDSEQSVEALADDKILKNHFLYACLSGGPLHLEQVREVFLSKKIDPCTSALATKILGQLFAKSFRQHKLSGGDALWLFCHLTMMCAQLEALDPKFITCTKPNVSHQHGAAISGFSLKSEVLINDILRGVPSFESETLVESDALALAFVKSLAGNFGVRGQGTICARSIGMSDEIRPINPGLVEALWCEAKIVDSISEHGPSSGAKASFLYEVHGLVSMGSDMQTLSQTLFMHGARNLHYSMVHNEKGVSKNLVRFLVSEEAKRETIEAFLVKGEASEVVLKEAEGHELRKRLVNIPMGSGNKTFSYRFYEHIYLDKTVRVEPVPEDLHEYVQKTDYSVDVARADMLMAWRKWRGQVAKS